MIKKPLYTIFIAAVIFSLGACATVKLTPSGEKARVLDVKEAANCQKRGKVTVSVKPSILTAPRQQTVIAKELQILARNSAVNMDGDTVAVISKIDNGRQTFEIYRCVPR